MIAESALQLLQNAALLVAIAVVFDLLPRDATLREDRSFRLIAGMLLGVTGILVMTTPWQSQPGLVVDTRSVLLSSVGLFFGGLPTIIAVAMMSAWRVSDGGVGTWVGLASIVVSASAGMAWRYRRRRTLTSIRSREFYLFGVAVTCAVLALFLTLPNGIGERLVAAVAIPMLVIYPVATLLLGHLMMERLRRAVTDASLAENEERLRMALDAGRIGLYDLDLATGRAGTNTRYAEMLGEDPATYQATTAGLTERMHPDDRPAVLALFAEYVAGERTVHRTEFRLQRSDGAWCWVLDMGKLLERDRAGRPRRLIGVHMDVTAEREAGERTRAVAAERVRLLEDANASRRALLSLVEDLRITQQTLQESLDRYTGLIRHSPDAILVNRDDRIVLVNEASLRLFGARTESELLGRSPYEFIHPDVHDGVREGLRLLREKGQAVPMLELRIVRMDGEEVDVEAAASAFEDDGQVAIHVVLRDITQQKRAQSALVTLNAELETRVHDRTADLEEAYRELESFSYSVSHDLRAPLRAITGFSQILNRRHREQLDETGRHYLDNITDAGERMGALIEDLLSYSRIGRRDVRREPLEVGGTLDAVVASLHPRVEETGARLEVIEPLAVPLGDPTLFQQVLLNLIANALTYTRPGVRPEVTVRSVADGDQVVVSVLDNGIGIAPEHQERVFEVFARLHTDDEIPGTGIGLAIVRKAARLMDAEITLRSTPGDGATFMLTLPAAEPITEAARVPAGQP